SDFQISGSAISSHKNIHNGFAARIGGDEFAYIIIVPKGSETQNYRNELYNSFDEFNKKSLKPYNIEVAVGDYLYEKGDSLSIDDSLHQADERLYYEKNARKKKSVLKGME
ncbi:MAG: diguanylate cyclase, partial [Eubacteriales bacterium]|nr:diguanylate cyclase [Eubacteriales bacterium]